MFLKENIRADFHTARVITVKHGIAWHLHDLHAEQSRELQVPLHCAHLGSVPSHFTKSDLLSCPTLRGFLAGVPDQWNQRGIACNHILTMYCMYSSIIL